MHHQEEVPVISTKYKSMTCQAAVCEHNNQKAGCKHDWLELDESGACIFLTDKPKLDEHL